MYEVLLMSPAQRFFRKADKALARRLKQCFLRLAADPHGDPSVKRLTGDLCGKYRYRLGEWRVIYAIDEACKQVHVLVIAHRRESYR
jgi:mRNA interferase RelE/StbE